MTTYEKVQQAFHELAKFMVGKKVKEIIAGEDFWGFDIVFEGGSSIELYGEDDNIYWALNEGGE